MCSPPAEIIFLRAITPAHPSNHADFIFDITEGNLRDSFDIIKRYMDGMTVGECPVCPDAPLSSPPRASRTGKLLWTSSAPTCVPFLIRSHSPSGLSWSPQHPQSIQHP